MVQCQELAVLNEHSLRQHSSAQAYTNKVPQH